MDKRIILIGILIAAVGLIWEPIKNGHYWRIFGNLPGDITIKGENSALFLPLGTCLAISVALSFLSWIYRTFFRN